MIFSSTLTPSYTHIDALATHESYNLDPGIVDDITQALQIGRYWHLKALNILTQTHLNCQTSTVHVNLQGALRTV